ncbi:hypothetical protein SAMN05421847_0199 [Halpernia humi]|uniref:Phage-Barnase-EndoU-ColicinE5/D-RelE like nuclease 3 domain-containing protein n=1 Tax=Halpernia humi TaxID=493375 RepID=A0A1H5SPD1_9FLAO|nr:hypothetical protein [Halpernia humi]SEF51701.1 hypothetical protein SAMN05421847_0199 [Halpernia humi]
MKRKCKKIISTKDGTRAIYIDDENSAEILEYINRDDRHKKKFKFITDLILGKFKNTDLYDKEDIDDSCKDVTVMKFFKGQENDRIYCKEVKSDKGVFVVVAGILHTRKKSQKNSSKEKSLITKLGKYDYEV